MTGSRIGPFTSIPAALVQNKDVSLGNQLSFQDGPRGRLFRVWSFGWEPMRQGSPRDFATLHVLVPFRRPLTHPEFVARQSRSRRRLSPSVRRENRSQTAFGRDTQLLNDLRKVVVHGVRTYEELAVDLRIRLSLSRPPGYL